MDAWRSPRGDLNDHSENQFLNLLRRLSSPDGLPDLVGQSLGEPQGLELYSTVNVGVFRAKSRTFMLEKSESD